MSDPRGWTRYKVRDLILHHASGPSPTCDERNIADDEWGLLKTTAVTWDGWDPTAHKVPPPHFWGNRFDENERGVSGVGAGDGKRAALSRLQNNGPCGRPT
jgi:type I restriction enzyme S subunit